MCLHTLRLENGYVLRTLAFDNSGACRHCLRLRLRVCVVTAHTCVLGFIARGRLVSGGGRRRCARVRRPHADARQDVHRARRARHRRRVGRRRAVARLVVDRPHRSILVRRSQGVNERRQRELSQQLTNMIFEN